MPKEPTDFFKTVQHTPQNKPYFEAAYFLWQKINELDSEDHNALHGYLMIVDSLIELFDLHLPVGYMRGLSIWISLKLDAPSLAVGRAEGLRKDYPEVFAGRE